MLGGHVPAELTKEDTALLLPVITQKEVNPDELQVHFHSSMLPSLLNEENHLPNEKKKQGRHTRDSAWTV